MVGFVVRIANEPARRFKLLWTLVGCGIATIFMVIGAGYAVGGRGADSSDELRLLQNIENPIGGLHAHGFILMGTALWLAYSMGNYNRLSRQALQWTAFYSLATSTLIFGGWFFVKISFGAPWWYLFTAFLSIVLLVLAPPLDRQGRLYRGEDGGGRA